MPRGAWIADLPQRYVHTDEGGGADSTVASSLLS